MPEVRAISLLAGVADPSAPEPVGTVEEQVDDTIRCSGCGHEVTAGCHAIEVQGGHAHTFRNPAGWSFRIGCFADAPGAAPVGEPSAEATWFPPYAWRLALCGGCGGHLGWWFVGADAFAGLILARLG